MNAKGNDTVSIGVNDLAVLVKAARGHVVTLANQNYYDELRDIFLAEIREVLESSSAVGVADDFMYELGW